MGAVVHIFDSAGKMPLSQPSFGIRLQPDRRKYNMRLGKLSLIAIVSSVAATAISWAALQPQRLRGTVESVNSNSLMLKTNDGKDVSVVLDAGTKYAGLVKANFKDVTKDAYIGTATKGTSNVALEVVIFPPSMRGTGDGHYPWDEIIDTTASGRARTKSAMTNGNVASVSSATRKVKSAMTNGNVDSASTQSGSKKITVTYHGGKQEITIPPTAPVVAIKPSDASIVKVGAHVFIKGTAEGGKVTAQSVAVGENGLTPPM